MKIDLEKELGLSKFSQPDRFPWLKVVALVCVINLILAAIAVFLSARREPVAAPQEMSDIAQLNSQSLAEISKRLAVFERMQRDIRINQKKSRKEMSVVAAAREVEKKRERMKQKELKKSGLTDEDIRALKDAGPGQQPRLKLSDEETSELDALVDSDDSGAQVRAYIRAISSVPKRNANIQYLKNKGDQWFSATLPLLNSSDPDANLYVDSARYFYDIINDVSDNNALIAYVNSKLHQLELAIQKADFREAAEEERISRQEELEQLREDLRPRETAAQAQARLRRKRRTLIKDYPSSNLVRPYKTDWDPDPRVREERGIE